MLLQLGLLCVFSVYFVVFFCSICIRCSIHLFNLFEFCFSSSFFFISLERDARCQRSALAQRPKRNEGKHDAALALRIMKRTTSSRTSVCVCECVCDWACELSKLSMRGAENNPYIDGCVCVCVHILVPCTVIRVRAIAKETA